MTTNSECPIWGADCIVRPFDVDTDPHFVENSFRAGGDYEIFSNARAAIRKLDDSERAPYIIPSRATEAWRSGSTNND